MKLYRYELISKLSSGFEGQIWKGKDNDGNIIAMKVFKKNIPTKYISRSIAIPTIIQASGGHENISNLLDCAETEYGYLVVSEFINGNNLFSFKNLTDDDNVRIAKRLASAYTYMHSLGISHRDIKLENVMIDEEKKPIVIDFGLSCLKNGDRKDVLCVEADRYIGTMDYLAPELLESGDNLTDYFEADVYAFGVLLYELFNSRKIPYDTRYKTGIKANDGKEIIESKRNVLRSTSGNEEVDDLIGEMLAADPDKRPTMEEVERRLENA